MKSHVIQLSPEQPTTRYVGRSKLIVELREKLSTTGLDAGPDTIAWHLEHDHSISVSRATISRHLLAAGLVAPEPKKWPKSSYIRFEADQPNETWQPDFTHYRLTRPVGRPGPDTEILSWLDDRSRFALSSTAHHRVTVSPCSPSSAEPLPHTGLRPPRSPTTGRCSPPGSPVAA
jgi:hypothetical protein